MNTAGQHFPASLVVMPPQCAHRRAAFYLAAEEYLAREKAPDNYLFTWQLRPTVVMGRNQVAHQEVDLDFCHRNAIDVIRRRSGGGAIYADEGNIMVSLVTRGGPVEPLFEEYAHRVAQVLEQMGVPTHVSGRNDITIEGGGKVCGNAFYHLAQRNIVHGTMLYDTASHLMEGALHPDVAKLEAKGVKSVRKRVALLKDYLPFGVDELRQRVASALTDRTTLLIADDVARIEHIEQTYYDRAFLLGSSASGDVAVGGRIEGCGSIEVRFVLRGSLVEKVTLIGDYFEIADATDAFSRAFAQVVFTPQALCEAIATHHPERAIRNLTADALESLILSGLKGSAA